MPTYTVTHPKTGKTLEITGSRMPREDELQKIFGETAEDGIKPPKEQLSNQFPATGTIAGGAIGGALLGPLGIPLGAGAGAAVETTGRQVLDTIRGNKPKPQNVKEAFGQSMENVSQTAGNIATGAAAGELVTAPFVLGKQLQQAKDIALKRSVESGKTYGRDEVFNVAEKKLSNAKGTGLLDKLTKKVEQSKVTFTGIPKNARDLIETRKGFRDIGWTSTGEEAGGVNGRVARAIYRSINDALSSKDKTIRAIDAMQSAVIKTPQVIKKGIGLTLTGGAILGLLRTMGMSK